MGQNVKRIKKFSADVFNEAQKHDLADAAAALSFRSLMAIIPTLTFLVIVLGEVLGRARVLDWFLSFLENTFGTEVLVLEQAVEGTFVLMSGFVFSSFILFIAVWSSVSMVHYVRQTFFSIFNLEISSSGLLDETLKSRKLSFLYTILVLFLILTVILGQGLVSLASAYLSALFEDLGVFFLFKIVNLVVFSTMVLGVFGLVYWFMSAGTLHLRPILLGSAFSSIMFLIFNTGLSIYASYSFTLGLFGASSFLVVLLIWIYYSAFTLFVGGVVAYVADKSVKRRRKDERTVYI